MILTKKGTAYIFTDFNTKELLTILKMQVNFALVFTKPDDSKRYVYLSERTIENGVQCITASVDKKNTYTMQYNELLSTISELMKAAQFSIEISSSEYQKSAPMLTLIPDVNMDLVDNCVALTYDDGVYGLLNPPVNRKSNKIYYFELNNSILAFSKDGPSLFISDKISNIEDLWCK